MKVSNLRKREFRGLIWTAILVGGMTLPVQAKAEDIPFYKLMCSYSRDMGFAFESAVGPRGRVLSGEGAEIEFTFSAAPKGYLSGQDTLRPGQCTWMDRAMKDSEPKKVKLYKQGVKAFRIRNTRDRSYFLLTGATSERNGRESYDIIYSMPAEEGTLFILSARQAADRGPRFSVLRDYLEASDISTVAYVKVPAR